jgi:uncharacterized Fe-S cluster-containing protein
MLIRHCYEKHYRLYFFEIDLPDVGHSGASRARIYVIMAHRVRARVIGDPVALFKTIIEKLKGKLTTKPRDYFVASPAEIRLSTTDLAMTRKTKLKNVPWMNRLMF